MTWWNLGGMNPKFKEFTEKHPDKTMIGMTWAMYWRLMVLIFALEMGFMAVILFGGLLISLIR